MPRKPQPWFRFYTETFADRKIRRIPAGQRWVWAAVMGLARESPDPGRLLVAEQAEPLTVDELADYAAVSLREARAALASFRSMGMIHDDPDGTIVVTNWQKRQFESDDVTARTRAHREKQRDHTPEPDPPNGHRRNVPTNVPSTVPANGAATPHGTDVGTSISRARPTETETENREQINPFRNLGGDVTKADPRDPASPPRCSAHRNHPDPPPCAGCARARETAQRHDALRRTRLRQARANCPDCHGTGWTEHDDGTPAGHCTHQRSTA